MSKVLLVEDDTLLSGVLADELRDEGYEPLQAFDGVEGLERAFNEKPDMILLDIMMPKKDGIQMLRELRVHSDFKVTPVIVLTASVNEARVNEALAAGANDALIKSRYTMKEVIQHLAQYQKTNTDV